MSRYAAVTLLAVAVLGVALAVGYRDQAQQRGVAEGRSEAQLVARTAVEPLLDGRSLSAGLSTGETAGLRRLVGRAVRGRDVLRLRLRDLAGRVVFSDDGSGFGGHPEDEALEAARGGTLARLTRFNSDTNDRGTVGPAVVEVYLPLRSGDPARRVGVLEVYLPYAPISVDVGAGLDALYVDLAVGLGALYLVLFCISVSVSKGLRAQLRVNRHLAEHDSLTDLPNRAVFQRRLQSALAGARARRRSTVVAIVDLDRFKEVNDALGHSSGDRLLSALAARLAAHVGRDDTVARLGGDEFGILLHEVDDAEAALCAVRAVIGEDVELEGIALSVESSIGYAVAPEDGSSGDELLQRADVAMYVAKARHAGVVRYVPAIDHYDAGNLTVAAELRHAIEAGELVLHYQPKATLPDTRVTAVEALVRWQHPRLGLLGPDRFVPLAEQTDLIGPLTRWVLRRALADLASLSPEDGALAMAVNVSARNLTDPDFADVVIDALRRSGIPSRRLIVEVTETALLADPQRAAALLGVLDSAGIRVSIDDFGAGQTSLGHLSTFPVHELKIDQSLVRDMVTNGAHRAIVRSVVDLGHNLSLAVVGEGVESPEVLAALAEVGCDLVQGFLLARPMPVSDLEQWLLHRPARATIGSPA